MTRSRKRRARRRSPSWPGVIRWAAVAALAGVVIVYAASTFWRARTVRTEEPIVLKKVRVQVLNGCGVRGAGREVADLLRLKGYDVIDVGNADAFDYTESMVVDRAGAGGRAVEIARALGVTSVVKQRTDGSPYDATVIVGADFRSSRTR